MLAITIRTAEELKEAMQKMNRDYYSLEAYEAMIELFEECEDVTEFDAVAISCDFNEETAEEIADNYGLTFDGMTYAELPEDMKERADAEVLEYCNYHAFAEALSNGKILYTAF